MSTDFSSSTEFSSTDLNRAHQWESMRATQRRHIAGLALRDARRDAMAHPHDPRNPEKMAVAAAHVKAAQEELEIFEMHAAGLLARAE